MRDSRPFPVFMLPVLILAMLLFGPPAAAQTAGPAMWVEQASSTPGASRAPVVARLASESGAPISGARVTFLVDGERDGEARTDETGAAAWRLRRTLTAGSYVVEAFWNDYPAVRASLVLIAGPPILELRPLAPAARVGDRVSFEIRLLAPGGSPLSGFPVAIEVDGRREGTARTDEAGRAEWMVRAGLNPGAHRVRAVFEGAPPLLAASAELTFGIAPVLLEVRTVPPLPGTRFSLDGEIFTAGSDGIARTQVTAAGEGTLAVESPTTEDGDVRTSFARWGDAAGALARPIKLPASRAVDAGFDVYFRVIPRFSRGGGVPVRPERLSSLTLASSLGLRHTVDRMEPFWLQSAFVTNASGGLESRPIGYAVEQVVVDSSNVVNQSQQRFEPSPGGSLDVSLLLYTVRFAARDALLNVPAGHTVLLSYPDGRTQEYPLDENGGVTVEALARGLYRVRLKGPGIGPSQPIALTRDDEVPVVLVSYLDLGIVFGALASLALGLLFIGRGPAIARRLRRERRAPTPQPATIDHDSSANAPVSNVVDGVKLSTVNVRGVGIMLVWLRARLLFFRSLRQDKRAQVLLIAAVTAIALALGTAGRVLADQDATSELSEPFGAPAERIGHNFKQAGSPPVLAYYGINYETDTWDKQLTDSPLLGKYASEDPRIMREHVRMAKEAGIDGFVVFWRNSPKYTRRLGQLTDIANGQGFQLAVAYDARDLRNRLLSISRVQSDLDMFTETFAGNAAFNRFGRPMIIWYGIWNYPPEAVDEVTSPRRGRLLILASARSVDEYQDYSQFVEGNAYYWSSVDPESHPGYEEKLNAMAGAVRATGGVWLAPAAPGYRSLGSGGREVTRNDGETLRKQFAAALGSAPDAIGLISWNRFRESTHVEPSAENGVQSLQILSEIRNGTVPGPEDFQAAQVAPEESVAVLDFDSSEPGEGQFELHGFGALAAVTALLFASIGAIVARNLRRQ